MTNAIATPCRCGGPMTPHPNDASILICAHCDNPCKIKKNHCPRCAQALKPEEETS